MKIPVIYEDNNVVFIDKPAGLVVHADGKTDEPSVAEWFADTYPGSREVGEPLRLQDGAVVDRPGIVHRLDRDTSGVLVIAKTKDTFQHLKSSFQSRSVKKKYLAFIYGTLKEKEGLIDRPIGKSRSDFRKWSAEYGARGEMREARTQFKVLAEGGEASYIELRPETGRTHQLRVHMKAIGHSIVCDKLYAPKQPCILGLERLALHAASLSISLPDVALLEAEAPLPEDLKHALASLEKEK